MSHVIKLVAAAICGMLVLTGMAITQSDPGVQTATRGTGATIINPANDPSGFTAFFNDGLKRFQDVESVSGSPSGNNGLGPRFNSTSCSSCHAQPAVGGSGPASNPQVSVAPPGQLTAVASFIAANGPVREARFVRD